LSSHREVMPCICGVVCKPVDPGELLAAVDRALERDAAAASVREARELARTRWAELSPASARCAASSRED
jgi:hypothetical protein